MCLAACVASYCHDDRYRNLLDTPPAQQFDTADLQEPIETALGRASRTRKGFGLTDVFPQHQHTIQLPSPPLPSLLILQCARAAGKFEDFGKDLAAHFAVSA